MNTAYLIGRLESIHRRNSENGIRIRELIKKAKAVESEELDASQIRELRRLINSFVDCYYPNEPSVFNTKEGLVRLEMSMFDAENSE